VRVFYDCEFLEDGRTMDLISIGMVADDGREYYAVNRGDLAMWARVNRSAWLVENVLPHLPTISIEVVSGQDGSQRVCLISNILDPRVKPIAQIAREVHEFLLAGDGKPELWAWYAAFDHVVLAWLWGPMRNLPKGIPKLTKDLKQRADDLGNPALPEQVAGAHNALEDARHNAVRARFLDELAGERGADADLVAGRFTRYDTTQDSLDALADIPSTAASDPLISVRTGDPDPNLPGPQRYCSSFHGSYRGAPMCTRQPHPPEWQHIAGDGWYVIATWTDPPGGP